MANYQSIVKDSVEFDGEEISFTFSRLNYKEFFEIQAWIEKDGYGEDNADTQSIMKILEKCGDVLPSHIKSVEGITVDGEPATIEHLLNDVFFFSVVNAMFNSILSSSSPKLEEKKDLKKSQSE